MTLKRAFDVFFASLALVPLSPLLLLIALLIKFESRGPVFYRGVRSGMHGRRFHIFKFRTMVANAEQVGGPTTGKDDRRITRVGKYLRRYKLDELPQVFNVLQGEMSVVGPRPEVPQVTDRYA